MTKLPFDPNDASNPPHDKIDPPDFAFTTDGCSGGMTAAWKLLFGKEPPWNDRCKEHDAQYWRGGSAADRRKADAALLAGVALNGHPVFAIQMWLAVRPGGHPMFDTSYRWAYGYHYPRGYVERKNP